MKRNIIIACMSLFLIAGSGNLFAQDKTKNVKTEKFKVEGNCDQCENRIETAARIKGVKSAEWDMKTGYLTVAYVPGKVEIMDVHNSIAGAGHTTSEVKADKEAQKDLPDCCKHSEKEGCDHSKKEPCSHSKKEPCNHHK